MSNIKAGKPQDCAVPAMSTEGTFRALLIERNSMLSSLEQIDRALVRKCVDEGWDDCIRLNYSRISRRSK